MSRAVVFVGERRSEKAKRMRVRWQDGRLAAKQLFDAFDLIGFDKRDAIFVNAYERGSKAALHTLYVAGHNIVGMGRRAQRKLEDWGFIHTPMVHPAARGRIRRKEIYPTEVRRALEAAGAL